LKRNKKYKILFLTNLGFVWFLYAYVPNFIVEIKNPVIDLAKTTLYEKPQKTHHHQSVLVFNTKDSLNLTADLYLTKSAKATVILLHGIRSSKEIWQKEALWLNDFGYNAVALDMRAHGDSQGVYCTFGYKEKQDISDLISVLQEKGITAPVGIWGHSLGGAVTIQALATDPRLKFGIVESAYADFSQITKDYSRYYLHFESDILNDFLLTRAGEKADFPADKVNPVDFCNKITQPVLIVHGTKDPKIAPENAQKVFNNIKSNDKQLIWIKGAGHTNLHQIGGEAYRLRINDFLSRITNR